MAGSVKQGGNFRRLKRINAYSDNPRQVLRIKMRKGTNLKVVMREMERKIKPKRSGT